MSEQQRLERGAPDGWNGASDLRALDANCMEVGEVEEAARQRSSESVARELDNTQAGEAGPVVGDACAYTDRRGETNAVGTSLVQYATQMASDTNGDARTFQVVSTTQQVLQVGQPHQARWKCTW